MAGQLHVRRADHSSLPWTKRLTGASLLVFANKTDVEGCMTENEIRQVSKQQRRRCVMPALIPLGQGLRLDEIQTHRWNIVRCSALTGFNLDVGLEWVVEDAKSKLWLY